MKIGIIEDDAVIREGLRTLLNKQAGYSCNAVAISVEHFLQMRGEEFAVDMLLLDIGLPGMSGLDALRQIKQKLPETRVIMMTGHDESAYIFKSFTAGASGYLFKNTLFTEVRNAIESVAQGHAYLSPVITRKVLDFFNAPANEEIEITNREREIVQCLVDGLSYKLIADRLDISFDTVRYHLKNLYKKLRVNSKSEVISKALRSSLVAATV